MRVDRRSPCDTAISSADEEISGRRLVHKKSGTNGIFCYTTTFSVPEARTEYTEEYLISVEVFRRGWGQRQAVGA